MREFPREAVAGWLGRCGLCEQLPEDAALFLAGRSTVSELQEGGIVYEDNDLPDAVYVVAEGGIGFLMRAALNADFVEVASVSAGQFFGEGAILDRLGSARMSGNENESGAKRPINRKSQRRARMVCRGRTILIQIPSRVFAEFIELYPIGASRNLLKHSADKSRMGFQKMLEDVLERETNHVFDGMVRWMKRHTEDVITTLRLNSDLLREHTDHTAYAALSDEISASSASLADTLKMLSDLGGFDQARPILRDVAVVEWWRKIEKDVAAMTEAAGVKFRSYVEDLTVVTNASILTASIRRLLESLAGVMAPGELMEFRVGKTYGVVEFHAILRFPGLTEFTALRLFQPFMLSGRDQDAAIGLSLVRKNIATLGGQTFVKRRSHETITVAVTLPLALSHVD